MNYQTFVPRTNHRKYDDERTSDIDQIKNIQNRNPELFTWKLSIQHMEKIKIPQEFKKIAQRRHLTSREEDDETLFQNNNPLINHQQIPNEYEFLSHHEDQPQASINETALKFLPRTFRSQYEKPEFEYISQNQRKIFSISRYQSSLYNRKLYQTPTERTVINPNDLPLIRVLSSLPKFKMEKIYEMKKQTVRNLLNLRKNSSEEKQNKYIKPLYNKKQNLSYYLKKKKRSNTNKQVNDDYFTNSNTPLKQDTSDIQSDSSINYRIKTQAELSATLANRIPTTNPTANQDNSKLIILTEKTRKNIFRIQDRLNRQFHKQEDPPDEKELKEIFQKQNNKKNFFYFENYFYQNYLLQNTGLQTQLSEKVSNAAKTFQKNISNMIERLDQKPRTIRNDNDTVRPSLKQL